MKIKSEESNTIHSDEKIINEVFSEAQKVVVTSLDDLFGLSEDEIMILLLANAYRRISHIRHTIQEMKDSLKSSTESNDPYNNLSLLLGTIGGDIKDQLLSRLNEKAESLGLQNDDEVSGYDSYLQKIYRENFAEKFKGKSTVVALRNYLSLIGDAIRE